MSYAAASSDKRHMQKPLASSFAPSRARAHLSPAFLRRLRTIKKRRAWVDCAIFAACKSSHHHREAPRCTNSCSKPQKIELVGNRDAKKHNERMKNNTVECSSRQVQTINHFKERILAQHNNSRKFLKGSDEFFNIFFTQWIGLHY